MLVPPYIAALEPYVTGRTIAEVQSKYGLERVVKLASNENPLGPSPLALDAIARELSGLHRYPGPGVDLRAALSERFGVRTEHVVVGSGSEGIMSTVIRTFLCDDDEVLTSEGTFIGIRVLAQGRGVRLRTVPLRDWRFDLPAIADAVNRNTKIIYLANPNNPTGTIFTRDEFDAFHARIPERVLILLDEAYFEYAADNRRYPDSLHYRYDNVITLRTFSKVYGLAGVRIGYGFAHEELIANLNKVKLPFEPSSLAQAAGAAALSDRSFLRRSLEVNARGKAFLMGALRELGFHPVPSEANFIMVPLDSSERADGLCDELLEQGVIIRPLRSFGLPQCVRISVGTQEENEVLIQCLKLLPALA